MRSCARHGAKRGSFRPESARFAGCIDSLLSNPNVDGLIVSMKSPEQVDEYLEGPYREDPFFKISLSAPRNNCYRLSRLITGNFEDSSYHRDYYGSTGTVDEAIIVTRLGDGSVVNISFMRLESHGEFSDGEYNFIFLPS